MRIRLFYAFLLILLLSRGGSLAAQSLNVRLTGDQLKVYAPQLRLLTGEVLQRLRDGASVGYVFEVAATPERNSSPFAQATYRFVFSYDLWEEKFAVTRVDSPSKSISHLASAAAEAWCLDNIRLPAGSLPADSSFWITLRFKAEEPQKRGDSENSTFTLGGLIDIFSKRVQKQEVRGSKEGGPFRLADLRRNRVP